MHNLLLSDFGIEISISESPVSYTGSRFNHSYEIKLNGEILFSGADFSPSPMDSDSPLDMLVSGLSFHCLKPGDTDDEYFDNYTPAQLVWANSFDCEQLQGLLMDFEDKNSEYYQDAFNKISIGFSSNQ